MKGEIKIGKIIKEVDLSNLPILKNGNIDWNKSIGLCFKFKYMDIQGEFKILENKDGKIKLRYKNYEGWILKHNIRKCKFGGILNKSRIQYKYKIGEIIKNKNQYFEVLDVKIEYGKDKSGYKVPRKRYKLKCLKCGYIGEKYENAIIDGSSCSCCGNIHVVTVKGINDIATTDPWMVKYFVNPEDAYKYVSGSNEELYFKCPYCNKIITKPMKISILKSKKHLPCICDDGKSYPEKFLFEMLSQIKDLDFIYQFSSKNAEWCKRFLYDFYIPKYNCIIEVHGEQHYKDGFLNTNKDQKEIDKTKRNLAYKNNISYYIEINCSKSNIKYIKEEIEKSELKNLINLKYIDWNKCGEFATSNLIKDVCDKYNEIEDKYNAVTQLMKVYKLSRETVLNYLKRGNELNWCQYESNKGKRVMVIETGDIYENVIELSKIVKEKYECDFTKSQIYTRCQNITKDTSMDKLHFKYI